MFRPLLFSPVRAALLFAVIIGFGFVSASRAANLLNNPGFESNFPTENQTIQGWTTYGGNNYNEADSTIAHSGTNYFKVYQAFNGAVNFTGIYQDYISGPGATYAADAWAYAAASDPLAGQNAAWIEITFRDAQANVLALYRSALVTTNLMASGAFSKDQWNDLRVTNQYDPGSFQITNTVTQLLAPPGTIFVRYQIVLQGDANNSSGAMYFDDLNLSLSGGTPYGDMNIVWNDEFDGTSINPNIWTNDIGAGGWGNSEMEYYTSRTNNEFVANGLLHIVARKESFGGSSYTSARMKTQDLFSFTYGRLEWRAQFPTGLGIWPALWTLGNNISSINWPNCGEIDVFENPGTNAAMVQSSIHSGSDATAKYFFMEGGSITNFHTYTLDWTTNALLFYVDGHLFETQTNWNDAYAPYPFPYNQPFFLLMNCAVGGQYAGYPTPADIDTAHTVFPAELLVDYVRIYNTTALALTRPSNLMAHLQKQENPSARMESHSHPVGAGTNQVPANSVVEGAFLRLKTP